MGEASGSLSEKAIETLRKELPAAFARQAIPDLLPGVIAPRYLANMGDEGAGPGFFKIGRKVVYERDSFLAWLKDRARD